MKKILATTDFSLNSWKAIAYGVDLAQRTGAELIVLNTYTLPYSNQTVLISMKEILKESAESGLEDVLKKMHAELDMTGVKVSTKAVHGDLLVTIDLMCDSEGIDIVIMGTKGATGLKAALLGSNTANIIRNIDRPVIAVPESYQRNDARHATLCADFANGVEKRVDFSILVEICKVHNAELNILHVIDPYEENIPDARPSKIDFDAVFPELKVSMHSNYHEDVQDGIKEFLADHPTNLLVMIRRNYNFIESIFHRSLTRSLAMHTEIPLLVLQEGKRD
jgi:nucleotide-binding universal stress UspA family protein